MKKKILFMVLVTVLNLILFGCNFIVPVESMYSSCKNFEQYKSDFEIVTSVVEKYGEGMYYIDKKDIALHDIALLYLSEPHDGDYIDHYEKVTLSTTEKESLYNIVVKLDPQKFERIFVGSNFVAFVEADRYLGVIYTQGDIESAIYKLVGHKSDRLNFLHNELSEDWYTIYY